MRNKQIIFLILMLTSYIQIYSQQVVKIVKQTPTSVVIQKSNNMPTYNECSYANYNNSQRSGLGITIRAGYNFKNFADFGGSIYYNFRKWNGNFGLSAGFDYGTFSWNNFTNSNITMHHWHGRAGFVTGKYFGVGGVFGQSISMDGSKQKDGGLYTTFYIPFGQWFGINIDAKWTANTFFTVGGGFIFMLPTK